jgi:NAD(P)-dependent dehydrogenase (short-subunit alcohol dehydrogenase family)
VRTVVVGATKGTGRALAEEYARRGAAVVITGRSAERATTVAAEIEGDVTGIALDLTRTGEIATALRSVGRVDRVVLVGGISKDHPYPGSTVVSAANAALVGIVRTLSIEPAPIRVNSVHPTAIEDSPAWAVTPEAVIPARPLPRRNGPEPIPARRPRRARGTGVSSGSSAMPGTASAYTWVECL